jgi:tetratricopeptide (TPR) repeat protein
MNLDSDRVTPLVARWISARGMRLGGLGLVLFLMLGWHIAPGQAALHIDTSYNGRYRSHAAFQKFLADLPFVYQESAQKINRSLGLPFLDHLNVIVVFSDHLTHNGFRLRGKRRSVSDRSGKILHYIYLDLEFLVEGQATLLEEMTHELTHAIMAEMMGLERYDALPMWIKEGTAVHAADQGLARIRALTRRGVDWSQFNEDESLDGNPISLEKYVANYLKIQFLLKTYGVTALHTFVQRLVKSGDVAAELARCFKGLTEDVMNQYAHDYITRTLADNSRPQSAQEQMQRGIRFFDEGEYLSARLALTDALYGGLPDADFQKAAYLLAECYIQERNPQSAISLLRQIRPDPRTIPVDRFQFLTAYTHYAMGLMSEAYLGFKQAFEGSTNPAVQEGALYYLIRILLDLQNREEANRVLEFLRTNFPRSAYLTLATRVFAAVR